MREMQGLMRELQRLMREEEYCAMKVLRVPLPEREYPILIGTGVLQEAVSFLKEACPSRRAAVVSDDKVWPLHGGALRAVLEEGGIEYVPVIVPQGERSKSLACLETLYEAFCRFRLRRDDAVLAFGGGVVGDLAGFAAATFLRGVAFVQVPTTLMAQVDSSVGGKVAVNLPQGKNLVGSFYQPRLVVADVSLLETLEKRDMDSGMAEVVKYAALGNERLGGILRKPVERESLGSIVALSCESKAGFVREDEREKGVRTLLNLGHTFAHAIEAYYGYGAYRHGEAVARGMLLAARVGVLLGVCGEETLDELKQMLENARVDRRLMEEAEKDWLSFLPLVLGDKKNRGGGGGQEISLVLLRGIGDPCVRRIPYEELYRLVASLL